MIQELPFPFEEKLRDLRHYIHWSEDGKTVCIRDPTGLERDVLPEAFNMTSYKSFIRQLTYYGFKNLGGKFYENTPLHEFYKAEFVKRCTPIKATIDPRPKQPTMDEIRQYKLHRERAMKDCDLQDVLREESLKIVAVNRFNAGVDIVSNTSQLQSSRTPNPRTTTTSHVAPTATSRFIPSKGVQTSSTIFMKSASNAPPSPIYANDLTASAGNRNLNNARLKQTKTVNSQPRNLYHIKKSTYCPDHPGNAFYLDAYPCTNALYGGSFSYHTPFPAQAAEYYSLPGQPRYLTRNPQICAPYAYQLQNQQPFERQCPKITPTISRKRPYIHVHNAHGPLPVFFDKDPNQQILINPVSKMLRFSPHSPNFTMTQPGKSEQSYLISPAREPVTLSRGSKISTLPATQLAKDVQQQTAQKVLVAAPEPKSVRGNQTTECANRAGALEAIKHQLGQAKIEANNAALQFAGINHASRRDQLKHYEIITKLPDEERLRQMNMLITEALELEQQTAKDIAKENPYQKSLNLNPTELRPKDSK